MNKLIIASLLASMGNDTIDLTAEEVISYAKAMAVHIDFACGIVSVRLGEETRITATSSLKRYDYNNGVVSFTDEAGQWVLPSIDILGHDIGGGRRRDDACHFPGIQVVSLAIFKERDRGAFQ